MEAGSLPGKVKYQSDRWGRIRGPSGVYILRGFFVRIRSVAWVFDPTGYAVKHKVLSGWETVTSGRTSASRSTPKPLAQLSSH